MRTLNEQIQRVKDALVTCYNAIKRKGGTIPEAGERTLLNMPAAVLSIPQTHGVMTELNVTANGEYLPSDYDADGFSKVTAEFDTSSLPKVKVATFKVSNACINEEGRWEAEQLIDTSECVSMESAFTSNTAIKILNANGWDTSKVKNFRHMFSGCSNIEQIDAIGWNLSGGSGLYGMQNLFKNAGSLKEIIGVEDWIFGDGLYWFESVFNGTDITHLDLSKWHVRVNAAHQMFYNCKFLKELDVSNFIMDECTNISTMFESVPVVVLDLTKWNVPNVSNWIGAFNGCTQLTSLVGGKTYEEVVANNISCFNGIKAKNSLNTFDSTNLDHASLRALINGLADLSDTDAGTLILGATLMAKLTEEDVAIATEKNWTIA